MDKEQIKRNFSRYANTYDDYASVQKKTADKLMNEVDLSSEKSSNILEIGCGTGIYTKLLIEKFPYAKITAIDISPAMLNAFSEKIDHKVKVYCKDGEESILLEKYDLITANASMQWFNDLKRSLVRFKKMMNRNGKIIFSIFGPKTFYELAYTLKKSANINENIVSESFISKGELYNIGRKIFNDFSLKEEMIIEEYSSLAELLKKIKYTGASSGISKKFTLNRGILNNLERDYQEKYDSIRASYQIFFCRAL